MIEELRKDWKVYIQKERLNIIFEVPDIYCSFFHDLHIETAKIETEISYNSEGFPEEVTLHGFFLEVLFEEEPFHIGKLEYYDYNRHTMEITEWMFDPYWDQNSSPNGEPLCDIFGSDVPDMVLEPRLQSLLNSFDFPRRMDMIKRNQKVNEHRMMIEKYSGQTVTLIERDKNVYIVFPDGKEIIFK